MKFNMLFTAIVAIMMVSACSLFEDDGPDYHACDDELLAKIREQGSLRVWVNYDMPAYTPLHELLEDLSREEALEKREAQIKEIEEMHEEFMQELNQESLEFGSVKKFDSPGISLSVKEETLEYLCGHEMVKDISEVRGGSLH